MGLPLYDCSVRTSVVTANAAMVQLVPPAFALGSDVRARMLRLRQIVISNTTATGFGVGLGVATSAAVTPATAGVILRRSNAVAPIDPPSGALVWTTFGTTPTAPSGFSARLWVPGSQTVIYAFADGDELLVPPAATPLPFCIFNTATGQVADITLTWEE